MLETTSARHDERMTVVENSINRTNHVGIAIIISVLVQIASTFVNA